MLEFDIDALVRICDVLSAGKGLTPAERAELLRIAQGCVSKDSAAATDVSPETIRARRKRIYRKLGLRGAAETLSALLSVSLQALTSGGSAAHEASGAQATSGD
jgi:DNA-binding CsgD family transcriptional regulator